jgi:hypothetical protein
MGRKLLFSNDGDDDKMYVTKYKKNSSWTAI